MNELLLSLGLSSMKPALTALLLPPVPWIVLVLLGAWWLANRRPIGWLLVVPACAAMWLTSAGAVSEALTRGLLSPPAALGLAEVAALREAVSARPGEVAIVILGGGRETLAPEYGVSNLSARSIERLRFGLWLSRETGAPVAFSGGIGHGGTGQATEAEIASRIASREFNRPIKWAESTSRDTRENATFTVGLLRPAGIKRIVVVTHGWHMPRAMAAFNEAVRRSNSEITLTAAPMGMAVNNDRQVLRWLPSSEAQMRTRDVLREWLGRLLGS